jgi:MarR family transcriptional regulator, transcriptional regulator for hemolysin
MSSEKLDNILFYTLEKAIKAYRQFAQRNINKANFDITIDQWLVLKTLQQNPDSTQQQLATTVFKDNGSITRIIDLLIEKDYLTRESYANDRRRFKIAMTDYGLEILKAVHPLILNNRKTALTGLSNEDMQQCWKTLQKIISNTQTNL